MKDLIQEPERRSIRNISIEKPQRAAQEPAPTRSEEPDMLSEEDDDMPPPPARLGKMGQHRKSRKRLWWILGIVFVLLAAFIFANSFFEHAEANITPRQAVVELDMDVIASLNPIDGEVGMEVVTISREAERSVESTGTETIERPSSGTIIVYNDFDGEPQRLIKNTRFETPEGLVYRIQESITVPGQRTDATGATIPGSVEARVFADQAGEEYNIDLTDFTIPAFKESNDPRFDKFYARSKTAMTDGFSGTVRVASPEDTAAATEALEAELAQELAEQATTDLPEGFMILSESIQYSFEELPPRDGAEGEVLIVMRGEATMLAANSRDIAAAVARERITNYQGEPIMFGESSLLELSVESDLPLDLATAPATTIGLKGPATLMWTFDTEELRARLAEMKRSETATLFGEYPGIERADIEVQPFWKRTLPEDTEKIDVAILLSAVQ